MPSTLWLYVPHKCFIASRIFCVLCALGVTQSEHGIIMAACPPSASATLIMTADYSVGGVAGLLLALLVGGIVSSVSLRCCRRLTCVDKRLTGDTAESHIILTLNLVWIPFRVG